MELSFKFKKISNTTTPTLKKSTHKYGFIRFMPCKYSSKLKK